MIHKLIRLSKYSMLSALALVLGFARELTVSGHFGLSKELDVYVAILGFFNFFGAQIANVLEMVFISKSGHFASPLGVLVQLRRAVPALIGINLLIAGILFAGGPYLLRLIFPAFTEQQLVLGMFLLNFVFLAIFCANFSGLIRASLNVLRVFTPGMLAGSIVSICTIAGVVFYSETYGVLTALLGFIVGNGLVLILVTTTLASQIGPSVWKQSKSALRTSEVHSMWSAAFVVLIGEFAYQGFSLTERSFAADIGTGTISAFFYAWALINVPLALVVMPVSNVVYPQLAKAFTTSRGAAVRMLVTRGGLLTIAGVIVAIGFSYYADWIVKILFLRGRFTTENAELTAQILQILVFALPMMSFGRIVRYSLYSLSNYSMPTLALMLGWAVMTILARWLTPLYGIQGLSLASVIAISSQPLVMLLALVWILRKPITNQSQHTSSGRID